MRLALTLFALALFVAPGSARAAGDSITLTTRDGQTVRGTLVDETARGFLVAVPGKSVLVEYGRVVRVERGTTLATHPSPASAKSERVDVGFGGGVVWGPTVDERSEHRLFVVGPVLVLPIEISGDRLGLRITPTLSGGFVGPAVWRRAVELDVDVQLRVHLSRRYAIGLGGFVGGALSTSGVTGVRGMSGYGAAGPTLTPLDLRLGASRRHEVQLALSLAIDFGHGRSGVEALRPALTYAYHF